MKIELRINIETIFSYLFNSSSYPSSYRLTSHNPFIPLITYSPNPLLFIFSFMSYMWLLSPSTNILSVIRMSLCCWVLVREKETVKEMAKENVDFKVLEFVEMQKSLCRRGRIGTWLLERIRR